MLVLTREPDESIVFGSNETGEVLAVVTVLATKGRRVRLGISAPQSVFAHRTEVYTRIKGPDGDLT